MPKAPAASTTLLQCEAFVSLGNCALLRGLHASAKALAADDTLNPIETPCDPLQALSLIKTAQSLHPDSRTLQSHQTLVYIIPPQLFLINQ